MGQSKSSYQASPAIEFSHESMFLHDIRLMREPVDADSASLPTASTDSDEPQQSEIVSRGNRACGSKVGTSLPRKTRDPKRGEEECS